MNRKKFAYIIILASLILLILNITELDFENLKNNHYSGIASNLLLIVAMIFTLREIKKNENK